MEPALVSENSLCKCVSTRHIDILLSMLFPVDLFDCRGAIRSRSVHARRQTESSCVHRIGRHRNCSRVQQRSSQGIAKPKVFAAAEDSHAIQEHLSRSRPIRHPWPWDFCRAATPATVQALRRPSSSSSTSECASHRRICDDEAVFNAFLQIDPDHRQQMYATAYVFYNNRAWLYLSRNKARSALALSDLHECALLPLKYSKRAIRSYSSRSRPVTVRPCTQQSYQFLPHYQDARVMVRSRVWWIDSSDAGPHPLNDPVYKARSGDSNDRSEPNPL